MDLRYRYLLSIYSCTVSTVSTDALVYLQNWIYSSNTVNSGKLFPHTAGWNYILCIHTYIHTYIHIDWTWTWQIKREEWNLHALCYVWLPLLCFAKISFSALLLSAVATSAVHLPRTWHPHLKTSYSLRYVMFVRNGHNMSRLTRQGKDKTVLTAAFRLGDTCCTEQWPASPDVN